jgi:cation diffusion facilitator family transporter
VRWVLYYTVAINLVVTAVKLGAGYHTNSLSLVADGYDSLFNSVTNVVGLAGIYIASRPPDKSHPYGHRKYETLAALSVTTLLFVTTIELLKSALERLRNPVVPETNVWSFLALGISIVLHTYVTIYEYRKGKQLKSDFLVVDAQHTRVDVLVSVSVLVGTVMVRLGYPIADAILGLIIPFVIAKIGIDIIRENIGVLADAVVLNEAEVRRIVGSVPGVETLHRVRSRGMEDDVHLDLHVRVAQGMPVEQAHHIAHQVQRELLRRLEGLRDVVVHIEPQDADGDDTPDIVERIRGIARRLPHSAVHAVRAHYLGEQAHVSLHLELNGALSVEQAHEASTQLEEMLRAEIPQLADVEVHVEPMRGDQQAMPVDGATMARVREVLDGATREIAGLGDCHDVLVSRVEGRLRASAHWQCDRALSLDEAHRLTRQLEQKAQDGLPDLVQVVVHVEPRETRA